MIEKGIAFEADLVFLDLEDAVAVPLKEESRRNVIRGIRDLDWGPKAPAYRMNSTDTPFFYRDLIDIVEAVGDAVRLIIVPKVDRPETLVVVDTLLTQDRGPHRTRARNDRTASADRERGSDRQCRSHRDRYHTIAITELWPGRLCGGLRMPVVSIGTMDHWDQQYPGHRYHYPVSQGGARGSGGGNAGLRSASRQLSRSGRLPSVLHHRERAWDTTASGASTPTR